MLGFLSLAGIVVNELILLVNFIKSEREPGATRVAEAAVQAAKARLCAILLTSVATIAGVLPLLTETSLQAQRLIPFVASIAFGLLVTTFLILLVVLANCAILNDFGLAGPVQGPVLARSAREPGHAGALGQGWRTCWLSLRPDPCGPLPLTGFVGGAV